MGHVDPDKKRSSLGRSWLLRGESQVAMSGLAIAALLIMAVAGCAWWSVTSVRRALNDARYTEIVSAVESMAETSATLVELNEVTTLRRLLVDASVHHSLSDCRIVLPDGAVIAHTDASKITSAAIPVSWPAGSKRTRVFHRDQDGVRIVFPLALRNRPGARLEVSAQFDPGAWSTEDTLLGVGAIGAAAMLGMLIVYRRMRVRARVMGVIRDALIDMDAGEKSTALLAVPAEFGEVAQAWNGFVGEMEKLQHQSLGHRVDDALATQGHGVHGLEGACDLFWHGLLIVDRTQTIRYANGAAGVLLHTDQETLIDSPAANVIANEELRGVVQHAVAGAVRTWTTIESEGGDGQLSGVIRYSIRSLRDGDVTFAVIIIEDITQQRVAEEARNMFVAQVTHELRSPLTNIRLYADEAIDGGTDDVASIEKALNVINQESKRLERIVGDMLSVAEIEAGHYELRKDDVRIDALLADLQADYASAAREKNITLTFDLSPKLPVVYGDRDKIALAAHNVLANAIKYTPESGTVSVSVSADEHALRLEVADTGIGISDEELERIFEKFYRANDIRVSEITGSGLGLALAREVLRMHGGDITIESELNKGSRFTMTLPVPVPTTAA